MQRIPVSRVAHTGMYSRVHICGRSSGHCLYSAAEIFCCGLFVLHEASNTISTASEISFKIYLPPHL